MLSSKKIKKKKLSLYNLEIVLLQLYYNQYPPFFLIYFIITAIKCYTKTANSQELLHK